MSLKFLLTHDVHETSAVVVKIGMLIMFQWLFIKDAFYIMSEIITPTILSEKKIDTMIFVCSRIESALRVYDSRSRIKFEPKAKWATQIFCVFELKNLVVIANWNYCVSCVRRSAVVVCRSARLRNALSRRLWLFFVLIGWNDWQLMVVDLIARCRWP